METIKSKITQIEVELLKFNKELIALQGSIPNQIQTSPKTKKEFDDFLANDNEMSPAAKQARIAAAKNLLNQNIPGMDRVLS
ncbi:MAG: hypothetical protein LBO09_02710 [Candidatus Peribacteria bacterium]|jgi:hypothetical protein|nr:hypothetical protein [Candidatus Peribacteria bacterium]